MENKRERIRIVEDRPKRPPTNLAKVIKLIKEGEGLTPIDQHDDNTYKFGTLKDEDLIEILKECGYIK
ncbi:MAG: hypothetical protein H6680_08335 [Desulfobacteraceae bacterium]|nr:hypothetical protein [Desulfobacteraceae bacterium]